MAELSNVIHDLLKNKKIEEGLSFYAKEMDSLYHRIALLHVSFHYYTYASAYTEQNHDVKKSLAKEHEQLQKFIEQYLNKQPIEESQIAAFRKELTDRVMQLTAYADQFSIYEYILNRIEYRYDMSRFSKDYYLNGLEQDVFQYLISDQDPSVVNMKLGLILEQLPMRLSTNKFYDLVKNALWVYRGSQRQSVLDFRFKLETAAGLYEKNSDKAAFPAFDEKLSMLAAGDYENLGESSYRALRDVLTDVTAQIQDLTDWYVVITDVVNALYSVILTKDAMVDAAYATTVDKIVSHTFDYLNKDVDDDVIEALFSDLEGVQERLLDRLEKSEAAMGEIIELHKETIEALGLTQAYDRLGKLFKLQSTSSFAELENEEPVSGEADEIFLQKQLKDMVERFDQCFASHSRLYRRAVMASVLPLLPTFLANTDEFKSYMHVALGQCTDEAERTAVMECLHMLMEENA